MASEWPQKLKDMNKEDVDKIEASIIRGKRASQLRDEFDAIFNRTGLSVRQCAVFDTIYWLLDGGPEPKIWEKSEEDNKHGKAISRWLGENGLLQDFCKFMEKEGVDPNIYGMQIRKGKPKDRIFIDGDFNNHRR